MVNKFYTAKDCNYKFLTLNFILFLVILPVFNPFFAKWMVIFFNLLYMVAFVVKISLFLYGFVLYKGLYVYYEPIFFRNKDCPIYTILVPLYKEKCKTIKTLLECLYELDYPKDKLDIKLILEKDDLGTQAFVEKLRKFFVFEKIVVPDGFPKTKPRACNYALKYARGDYLTIYDAEDRPEKYQLKKVLRKFQEYSEEYVCVQASLNYYNRAENFLSKCFSVEYSFWFDFVIRVLERMKLFFPLGGTSNHFKVDKLIEIGGWDSYNVTEDADMGVRIVLSGYLAGFVDSITNEEAPILFYNWLKQRTRWIKGFIQTYCVYMNSPVFFIKKIGWKNFVIFQVFIGVSFLFFISMPFVLFFSFFHKSFLLRLNLYLMLFSILTSFWMVVYKNKFFDIISCFFVFPLYWFLHSLAGLRSMCQLVKKPFYWDKTEHGLSEF